MIPFPIVHIIGLPGAGKTTLGKKLSAFYRLPVYYIGGYRCRFPSTVEGEADAWVALFRDLSRRKWGNCILETTGVNSRERFLREAFPFSRIVTIKLTAQRKVLYERIGMKKKSERGGDWLFSDEYRDKYEFVRKMFKHFKDQPADIEIDTTKLRPQEVFKKVARELEFRILERQTVQLKKTKARTFRDRLLEDLKDPEFRACYNEELQLRKGIRKMIKHPRISQRGKKDH